MCWLLYHLPGSFVIVLDMCHFLFCGCVISVNQVFGTAVIHHDLHSSSKASNVDCFLRGPVEVTAKFYQVSKVQLGQKWADLEKQLVLFLFFVIFAADCKVWQVCAHEMVQLILLQWISWGKLKCLWRCVPIIAFFHNFLLAQLNEVPSEFSLKAFFFLLCYIRGWNLQYYNETFIVSPPVV